MNKKGRNLVHLGQLEDDTTLNSMQCENAKKKKNTKRILRAGTARNK